MACAPLETGGGPWNVLWDGDSTGLGTGGSVNGGARRYMSVGPLVGLANGFWSDGLQRFVRINFVGGVSDASFPNSSHWGHAGSTIEDHDRGGDDDCATQLAPSDERLRPHIVIRQLGVNNLGAGDTPEEAAAKLLTLMTNDHAIRPDLIWILCTITPHESPVTDALHVAYNALITGSGGVADQCRALGMTVFVVDCHAAINPETELDGGAHPKDAGYQAEALPLARCLVEDVFEAEWPLAA